MSDNAPHPTPHPAALSARQAADMIGVNEKTVRRWIERGKLGASKDEKGAFQIDFAEVEQARAERAADASAPPPRPAAAPAANMPQEHAAPAADTPSGQAAPIAAASIDLQPLAELIERQGEEIRRLAEAATMWQYRAHHLEEQLKQLTAGSATSEFSSASEGPSQNAPRATKTALGATEDEHAGTDSFPAASQPEKTARPSWWKRLLYGG
jgi:excisionase family DNA binding protein